MPLLSLQRHGVKLLLPLAAVVALALGMVTEWSYQRSEATLRGLAARAQVRVAINTLIRRLLDAETAQRGYLLTGRAAYLEPSGDAARDIAEALAKLESNFARDPDMLPAVAALKVRVAERQSEILETLLLYDAGEHDRWHELLLTEIGREKMEDVRATTEALMATQDRQLLSERNSVFQTLKLNRAGVYLLMALGLLSLLFYVRKTKALEAARTLHADELQQERNALEDTVRHRTAELTELANHLQSVREDERGRLARELHDELGSLLTAAKLDLARLRRGLGALSPDLEQRVAHLHLTIDQGISLKRRITEDLRPSSLSNLGLVAALEIQAREFSARVGIPVHMALQPVTLGDAAQMTVYRVVQESFTNIAKYAAATAVTLTLKRMDGRACVLVQDNGSGFDAKRVTASSHGLAGMRHRVEAAGGDLRVLATLGGGTVIEACMPESQAPDPNAADAPD